MAGASLADVRQDLLAEAGIGVLYAAIGLVLLALFERDAAASQRSTWSSRRAVAR
jgi:hypothetical protein